MALAFPLAHNYGGVLSLGPKAFQKYDILLLKISYAKLLKKIDFPLKYTLSFRLREKLASR